MVARTEQTDVVLVGGGIMSATLGVFLKELEPTWNITLLERLDKPHRSPRTRGITLAPVILHCAS